MLELSLSRGGKWDAEPSEDESVDLITTLERPSFDLLDYINWCRFFGANEVPMVTTTVDRDLQASIGESDEQQGSKQGKKDPLQRSISCSSMISTQEATTANK
ncbi:hypothetical protein GUITHDRAFT_156221 [Guillardia theta CCMP2712]|uniref:Uncharacterized protein n=1 Tax=Guillardia theta (strain CCMP2712) TaxID=905079 RepID=L1I9E6_GUITC|nr:hypothetical protein GUITHDRAFT_156221 [Guillardia theta CCMP2712]EKX32833.1 hypothetical protein GUITHDRAFT_156221 [Guillardia theta CCMP2712]|mmetsp:Transcript_3409/g.11757  ORF Transcript_3409/g.11757 Transcript_3409/m.11757 type:complete len:103 (+) Transcript_3409:343-651(+)|eukprot:XP_005819813.1 hypothetical protein GUITHDRAFT_156221 [Guillardia theta CCMP2712]